MGSLSSTPKLPKTQPVYVAAPAPVIQTNTVDQGPSGEELAAENREQNLLRRGRSRYGTVATSFQGLLSTNEPSRGDKRKTLLGE